MKQYDEAAFTEALEPLGNAILASEHEDIDLHGVAEWAGTLHLLAEHGGEVQVRESLNVTFFENDDLWGPVVMNAVRTFMTTWEITQYPKED